MTKENKNKLQIYDKPSHIADFDTLQIIDDIKIPKEKWNTGKNLEPITKSYPNLGEGGATQATTTTPIKNYNLQKIKNTGN